MIENAMWFFDSNRQAQEFYSELWNILFWLNLIDLDKALWITNVDSIDLWDSDAWICIQVTSDTSSDKIKSTLKGYKDNWRIKKYKRICMRFIWNKKNYTTDLNEYVSTDNFNPETDIRDIWFIANIINNESDIQKLEIIRNFLEENLETKSIYSLDNYEIDKGIDFIADWLNDVDDDLVRNIALNQVRWEDFINEKNELNYVSESTYKEHISYDIAFNMSIINFLKNPENWRKKELYIMNCKKIQHLYTQRSLEDKWFYKFVDEIFTRSCNNITIKSNFDSRKIWVLLNNMYFNCDIWNNPNDWNR